MTAEEEALMTQLIEGPVAEDSLDDTSKAAAAGMVGRNVVAFYPMQDGSPGRQVELTQIGRMSTEPQQPPGDAEEGEEGGEQPPEGAAPAPSLTSITPNTATLGSPDTLIAVAGSDFVDGCVVESGGTALATTFTSATDLSATIPAAWLTVAAVIPFDVKNPDGQASATQDFTVA